MWYHEPATSFLFGAKVCFMVWISHILFPLGWALSSLNLLFAFPSASVKNEQDLACVCLVCCYEATSTRTVEWPRACLSSPRCERVH